jgi:hypothetical protein
MSAAIFHARATPETVGAVHPDAFRVRLDAEAEGHGPTLPDLPVTPRPLPSPVARVERVERVEPFALGPTGWRVVWIVATLASISVGVWLSLHAP